MKETLFQEAEQEVLEDIDVKNGIFHKGNLRVCKHCKGEILFTIYGLRDFCSEECKNAHRRIYHAQNKRQKRIVDKNKITSANQGATAYVKKGGYVSINPQDVDKSNPCQEPICEEQKPGSETFESYGGKKWYSLAKKHCCNFKVRQREGYCVNLAEPYVTFKKKCSECSLGSALNERT